jgi:hypothetical protein
VSNIQLYRLGEQVNFMFHYDSLSRLRTKRSLLLHINDVYLTEKQQISMFIFGECLFRQTVGIHIATNYGMTLPAT